MQCSFPCRFVDAFWENKSASFISGSSNRNSLQVHTSTPQWSRAHELHAETIVGKYIVRDYNDHQVALCLSIFRASPSRKMWVEHRVRRTRLSFLGSMPQWSLISDTNNPEGLSSSISAMRARRTTPRQAGSNNLIEVSLLQGRRIEIGRTFKYRYMVIQ